METMNGAGLQLDQFTRVPAGRYRVGISPGEAAVVVQKLPSNLKPEFVYHSVPQHHVEINEFFMSNRPVTLAQFQSFVSDTGYRTEAEVEGWGWTWEKGWTKKGGLTWERPFGNAADDMYRQSPGHVPVLQVSCNDALAFCQWLSEKTGTRYRLPGEEEWEAFAESMDVPGMDTCAAGLPGTVPATTVDFMQFLEQYTKDTRTILPGLAWEWTHSWFDAYPGGEHHDEYGTTYRVLRGGSLMSNPLQKGRQYRFRRCPTARSPFYCFRILLRKVN